MHDVITIGSGTLDVIVKSSDFQLDTNDEGSVVLCQKLGGKMDVEQFRMVSGGGATNVAVGCQRLGLRSAVVCEVGKDFAAQVIYDDLERDSVVTSLIVSERLEETAVSVLMVAGDGGRSIITHRGAAYMLEARDIPWQELEKTRWIHLGTLGGEKELVYELLDFGNNHEVGMSWTPSLKDLQLFTEGKLEVDLLAIDVLLLNQQEWEFIEQTIQQRFLSRIPMIVVTNGRKGGRLFVNGAEAMQYEASTVTTVEESGAGDAFASGFISGVLHSKPLPVCIEWGKKNAESVVQYLGAKEGLLRKHEMVKTG